MEIWFLYRCLDLPQTAGRGKIQDLFLTVDLTKGSFLDPSPPKSGERGRRRAAFQGVSRMREFAT